MNELSFIKHLRAIFETPRPYTSVYLNTEARAEQGPEELLLRWRALREKAQAAGAKDEILTALDSIVDGAHRHGDGLVVLASRADVVFRRYLRSPVQDDLSFGPLPRLLPLIEWGQENPPHVVMLQDRVGADVYVVHPDRDVEHETVEGDKPDIGRTSRGGWAQPRFQRGATTAWRDNAALVAEELRKINAKDGVDLVLIAGDVEAIHHLKANLPEQPRYLFQEIDGSRQVRLDELEEELNKTIAAFVEQSVDRLLEKFVEERGQADLAAEGVAGAIASRAKVIVIPELSEAHGPREGVGAILRYA